MKKSFSYPIIFMALLTAIFTLALAFLDHSTADRIALIQETELQEKILYVFDMDVPSNDVAKIKEIFEEKIQSEKIDNQIIYMVKEDNEVKAYAFPAGGPGLWGSINAYAAISSDYSTLLGVEFISHDETPGLGGRISEEWFKDQFRGLDLTESSAGNYIIYRPASGGNVDAIAGATLTSKSVSKFLNEDINDFIKKGRGVK